MPACRAAWVQVNAPVFDADYFNLSEKDVRVATAMRGEQAGPTMEQVKHVIGTMSDESAIERRNRALIAFTLLTGARTAPLPR